VVEYMEIRLWADRVRLVKRWLEHPRLWPDGVDSPYERFYLGREGYWGVLAKHLDKDDRWSGGIGDEEAHRRFAGGVVAEGVGGPMAALTAAERMRRMRARRKAEGSGEPSGGG
jgi:hypothetical protein